MNGIESLPASSNHGRRKIVRTIVVVALGALVIGLTLPNVHPPAPLSGNLPISANYHYDIVAITPSAMSNAADLRVGDHIEPQSLTPVGRLAMLSWYLLRPNESMKFTVDRAGHAIPVELREPPNVPSNTGLAIVKRTSATVFIIVAMVLLLMRPSKMTWGFYLYALGSTNGGSLITEFISPAASTIVNTTLVAGVYDFLGPLGLLFFVTNFPVRSSDGLRRTVERLTPGLALLLIVPSAAFVLFVMGRALPPETDFLVNGIEAGIITIAIVTLIAGFVRLDAPQRQRLRWVVAGFTVYYAAVIYQMLSVYLPAQGWPPAWSNAGWTSDVLNGFVVFIPITVAYAVLKHHVLDINFVIGRGLVYGILTSLAVATFAIVDWFIGTVLAQTRLAVAGEVVAAIAIGFWLNGLHSRVDRFVDAVIFRRRHLAEQRLLRVAAGLPHAQTGESVASMLIDEPISALGLLSGGLFRRTPDGDYRCVLERGLREVADVRISSGDALGVHLYGERGPVFLHHIDWSFPGLPDGPAAPVVAFPVFVRFELQGIAFYGPHSTGEAIDPDEIKALQSLSIGAAAALDHLEAAELRRQLDDTQRMLATMTAASAST